MRVVSHGLSRYPHQLTSVVSLTVYDGGLPKEVIEWLGVNGYLVFQVRVVRQWGSTTSVFVSRKSSHVIV